MRKTMMAIAMASLMVMGSGCKKTETSGSADASSVQADSISIDSIGGMGAEAAEAGETAEVTEVKNENMENEKVSANKEFREEENKKHKYHKTEFRYGNYYRTLYFPTEIDVEKSSADLKHGILELKLPKLEAEDKKTKKLEINE